MVDLPIPQQGNVTQDVIHPEVFGLVDAAAGIAGCD
jgi:hypothetical protein